MTHRPITTVDKRAGLKLRYYRLMRGLTQKELAQQVGVTPQQLQKYELGRNRLTVGTLHVLAEVLAIPIAGFLPPLSLTSPESHDKALAMMRYFYQLSPERREIVIETAKLLMKEQS